MDAARSIEGNPREPDVPRLALRAREAAAALGISERKLWELTNRGDVPHFRIGKALLYPIDRLREWVDEKSRDKKR